MSVEEPVVGVGIGVGEVVFDGVGFGVGALGHGEGFAINKRVIADG